MRIGSDEVEVELIGVDLGEEVAAASEVFEVEELVFFEAMNGFYIALVGVRGRRDAHMLAVAEGGRKIALELAAVVGLPDQIPQRDSVAIQMLLDACGEDGAEGGRTLLCKGPEQQSATDIPGGVLNHWQVEALGLGPVVGDIV